MLKCSHITCKVNDIKEVVDHYQTLGFTIQWGSDPKRAQNALLWFNEGPFIEFFQIPKFLRYIGVPLGLLFGKSAKKRWYHWCKAVEGWCDVALEPSDAFVADNGLSGQGAEALKRVKHMIGNKGISSSKVINGRRTRPDGQIVRYSFLSPEYTELPFIVSEYNPPQRPLNIEHANGATGIKWVTVGVSEQFKDQFQILTNGDKWIKTVPASHNQVYEVCLAGLKERLDANYLHGAAFTMYPEKNITNSE